jgi:hypothetical protein
MVESVPYDTRRHDFKFFADSGADAACGAGQLVACRLQQHIG